MGTALLTAGLLILKQQRGDMRQILYTDRDIIQVLNDPNPDKAKQYLKRMVDNRWLYLPIEFNNLTNMQINAVLIGILYELKETARNLC